jgi:hypothetical protein
MLLERLVALAARAADAAREGDMVSVDALLLEREPLLEQLAATLTEKPELTEQSEAEAAHTIADLARRDYMAMAHLQREILEARAEMLQQLSEVASAQAAVAAYVPPVRTPTSAIDVRG